MTLLTQLAKLRPQPSLRRGTNALILGAFFLISLPTFAAHHFLSAIIGGGYTTAESSTQDLTTLHNLASLRIGIDPQMEIPWFWGFDLTSFRIQRAPAMDLQSHHYGEEVSLVFGLMVPHYSLWLSSGFGQMRQLKVEDNFIKEAERRFKSYGSAVGGSYAIYHRPLARIELQAQVKLHTPERSWRQTYRYKHLRFLSILWAITIIDL